MINTDEQIATILARYGEPTEGNVWQVDGQAFIHHTGLIPRKRAPLSGVGCPTGCWRPLTF